MLLVIRSERVSNFFLCIYLYSPTEWNEVEHKILYENVCKYEMCVNTLRYRVVINTILFITCNFYSMHYLYDSYRTFVCEIYFLMDTHIPRKIMIRCVWIKIKILFVKLTVDRDEKIIVQLKHGHILRCDLYQTNG